MLLLHLFRVLLCFELHFFWCTCIAYFNLLFIFLYLYSYRAVFSKDVLGSQSGECKCATSKKQKWFKTPHCTDCQGCVLTFCLIYFPFHPIYWW